MFDRGLSASIPPPRSTLCGRPWFGTWPPTKRETRMAMDHEIALSKLATRRQLIGFALLGVSLILLDIVTQSYMPTGVGKFLSEIGKALVVAAVLGWAVDTALKHDLVR